jgi:hypothetical protein
MFEKLAEFQAKERELESQARTVQWQCERVQAVKQKYMPAHPENKENKNDLNQPAVPVPEMPKADQLPVPTPPPTVYPGQSPSEYQQTVTSDLTDPAAKAVADLSPSENIPQAFSSQPVTEPVVQPPSPRPEVAVQSLPSQSAPQGSPNNHFVFIVFYLFLFRFRRTERDSWPLFAHLCVPSSWKV